MQARRVPGVSITPDPRRVLFRPFFPGGPERARTIIARIMTLSDAEVQSELDWVTEEFGDRHRNLLKFFARRFGEVGHLRLTDAPLSRERELLIGAYFTNEYSLEAAALFNPSMIWHPDQSGLKAGAKRFILSLRATGEGHISSLQFRSGVISPPGGDATGRRGRSPRIELDPVTAYVTTPERTLDRSFERSLFGKKLLELGVKYDFVRAVMGRLAERFTFSELRDVVEEARRTEPLPPRVAQEAADAVVGLAESNYEIRFDDDLPLCERIIFPSTPSEVKGIEDARFVEFTDDDGTITYYATYTAYDGRTAFPQLLETPDFLAFKAHTLNGPAVANKGLGLFPRKIGGRYACVGRQDGENIYLMFSDNPGFWYKKEILQRPTQPWEFVQLGNCGSPIETEAGWLVLSHGVGPMRKYCIGAFLLDKDDPMKVLGRLPEPLLTPAGNEREGYVPNVVYSCGGQIFDNELIIPYAMSDHASGFATVPLDDLLETLERNPA
ncbi:glycoside hydrolase family 130 protein [Alienimonas californiensis]|uniref:Beta-1,4-mannooligosaccharide phosphorylase n=1 Tax=Alienimonas californiensis TaxID=2527989 RepID=A0A517PEB1_9PLAN|nr:glycoside hydrolase family 130 protein [Alienimonas californiensis]QDT17715.1 Beta-1,4-mannooligosaccharide phosphorylase [Alienimonas californiensis]